MTETVLEELSDDDLEDACVECDCGCTDEEEDDQAEYTADCGIMWTADMTAIEGATEQLWPENPPVVTWEGESAEDIRAVVKEITGYDCDNVIVGDHPFVVVPVVSSLLATAFDDTNLYPASIDAKLYPIVRHMWNLGITTWCSCQGGGFPDEHSPDWEQGGYITFYGEENYASACYHMWNHFRKLPGFRMHYDDNKGVFGMSWYWDGEIPSLEELLSL